MPPRYAYWTILVDDQPTAFRAGSQEDLMPTFKRLKDKQPTAKMMWFQNGKLWPSRIDAQEAMIGRGEMGRRGDVRQTGGGFRDRERRPTRDRSECAERPAWKPKTAGPSTYATAPADRQDPKPSGSGKLDWKPKGEFVPAPKRADRPDWKPKSDWKPKTSGPSTYAKASADRQDPRTSRPSKPEWKPKGSFDRKTEWKPKPKGSFDRRAKPEWKSRSSEKLDWKPKGEGSSGSPLPAPGSREKRQWVPKAEYKKSLGIEAKKDKNWRPGGEHKDPKQKYKDAKKAKWTKFKKAIRTRADSKKSKS